MIVQVLMAVGAVACAAAVANYIWQARGCFKEVYNQLKEECNEW